MLNEQKILYWLSSWYQLQCNDEWEHTFGIHIDTLDNPGWQITIDLEDTPYENMRDYITSVKNAEHDWFVHKILNKKFIGVGDPSKLAMLIHTFINLAEQESEALKGKA